MVGWCVPKKENEENQTLIHVDLVDTYGYDLIIRSKTIAAKFSTRTKNSLQIRNLPIVKR